MLWFFPWKVGEIWTEFLRLFFVTLFINITRTGWTFFGLRHDRPFHRSYFSILGILLDLSQFYEQHIMWANLVLQTMNLDSMLIFR